MEKFLESMIINQLKVNGIDEIISKSISIIKEVDMNSFIMKLIPSIIEKRLESYFEESDDFYEIIDEKILKTIEKLLKDTDISDTVGKKLPNMIEKRMEDNVEDNYEIDELIDTKILEAIKTKLKKIKIS